MKIKATPIKGSDLKPGDLFSTAPQAYWDNIPGSIGERVYIRTDSPAEWAPDFDSYVYKITIEDTVRFGRLEADKEGESK